MSYPPLGVHLYNDNRLRLTSDRLAHKKGIEQIPGAYFKGNGQDFWHIPKTWVSLKILTNTFGDAIAWDSDVLEWANEKWFNQIEPALELRNGIVSDELYDQINTLQPSPYTLKRYQVAGALFLATVQGGMLLDEQGTGKMITTATALALYPDTLPALIICPKSVLYRWPKELAKFGIKAAVLDGSDAKAKREKVLEAFHDDPETTVLVTTYSMLSKHSRIAGYGNIKLSDEDKRVKELNRLGFRTVIVDEAHRIKDPHSIQTRGAWYLADHAVYRWALTGTPIEHNVVDFWSLLRFCDGQEWPGKTWYIDRWVETYEDWYGIMQVEGLRKDTKTEFEEVSQWHWRRVMQDADIPPLVHEYRYCDLGAKEKKAYNDMKKQLIAELDDNSILMADNPMTAAGRLFQMAQAALVQDDDGNVTMTEPSAKLDLLFDTLQDKNAPIVVWFASRQLLNLAEERFKKKELNYKAIHGDVKPKDREQIIDDFQDGKIDYLLLMQQAISEGVTLTRSRTAIYVARSPALIMKKQSEYRQKRIGAEHHDSIEVIHLLTRNTVEEEWYEKMEDKDEQSEMIIGE